jgi:hypothetical protein
MNLSYTAKIFSVSHPITTTAGTRVLAFAIWLQGGAERRVKMPGGDEGVPLSLINLHYQSPSPISTVNLASPTAAGSPHKR